MGKSYRIIGWALYSPGSRSLASRRLGFGSTSRAMTERIALLGPIPGRCLMSGLLPAAFHDLGTARGC
jgi:hypothetical protein